MLSVLAVALSVMIGAALSLHYAWYQLFWPATAVLVAGLVCHRTSCAWVRSFPMIAVALSPASALFASTIVALSTFASIALGLAVPGWINSGWTRSGDPELAKSVAGAVLGALTGVIGTLWLKDAEDPDSTFWPAGAYRAALGAAFRGDPKLNYPRDASMERLYQAVYDDEVGQKEITGWDLRARWQRAGIVTVYGKTR